MSGGVGRSTQTSELVLTATNQTDRAFQQAAANADKLSRAMERNSATSEVLFQRAAGGVAGLERRLTAATAAMSLGEVLREGVTEFAAMDRRLTRLSQNADVARGTMDNMKKTLIGLANESGQSIESVVAGFETLVQQTGDYKLASDSIGMIVRANKALDASMTDTAQTARVLQDNLKFKPDELEGAFDIFVKATQHGKFEAKDFAANMPVLAQAMEQAGLRGKKGLAEMAAIMELIARKSPDNERAVLSFRDVTQKIFTPETSNHFKNAGVQPLNEILAAVQRKGGDVLAATAEYVDKALTQMAQRRNKPISEKMSLLAELFPEQDSQRGIAALLEYRFQVKGIMESILESAGQMKKRYGEVVGDTASQIDVLKNKFQELRLQLGKSIVQVGLFDGTGSFSKQIDEFIANIDRVGAAIARVREVNAKRGVLAGTGQAIVEMTKGAIGSVHEELERVTRLNIDQAKHNIDKYKARGTREDQKIGVKEYNERMATAKSAEEAGDTKTAEKERFKANQALTKRSVTGDQYRAAAEREEERLKRLQYQLENGFDRERVFGDSEKSVQPKATGVAGDAMAGKPSDEVKANALKILPAPPQAIQRVVPDFDRKRSDLDRQFDEAVELKRQAEELQRAKDEVMRAKRAAETPAFDRRMREKEAAEAREAEARREMIERGSRRVMKPEVQAAPPVAMVDPPRATPQLSPRLNEPVQPLLVDPDASADARRQVEQDQALARARRQAMPPELPVRPAPPAINQPRQGQAPTGGGLIDPYAPPGSLLHKSSFNPGQDLADAMRQARAVDDAGGTADTDAATARHQQEEIRLTEQTNAILLRLIQLARYGAGLGRDPFTATGEGGGGGSGSGGGGGGSGGGGGGGPGGGSGGGGGSGARVQSGGGGSGAGGAAGGTELGSTPRQPFGDGGNASRRPSDQSGAQPSYDGAKGGGRTGPTNAEGKANVASWMSFAQKAADQGGLGMTAEQAHGMIAGLQGEGGKNLNPRAWNPNDRGMPSGGVAQWRADRLRNLQGFAAREGGDWRSTEMQQKFLRHEMMGSGEFGGGRERRAYNAIRAQETRQGALHAHVAKFERPQFPDKEVRVRSAFLYGHGEDGNQPEATSRQPFTPQTAGANPPGDRQPRGAPGTSEGLRIKGQQAIGGGETQPGVFDLARSAQADLPGGVKHFAAFNDHYHQGTRSKHAQGLAFDTSLQDPRQSPQAAESMRQRLRSAGLSDRDFHVIDEYLNPSGRATGGHIHTQFNSEQAAQRYAEFAKNLRDRNTRTEQTDRRQDQAEKAQVAAIPRAPFTEQTAGANPPTVNPLRDKTLAERERMKGKNAFGGERLTLTDMLGPAPKEAPKPPERNAFGGENKSLTDILGPAPEPKAKPPEPEKPLPSQRVPTPPRRPDELKPPAPPPVEPPGIYRKITGGPPKLYGALENTPLPPQRPPELGGARDVPLPPRRPQIATPRPSEPKPEPERNATPIPRNPQTPIPRKGEDPSARAVVPGPADPVKPQSTPIPKGQNRTPIPAPMTALPPPKRRPDIASAPIPKVPKYPDEQPVEKEATAYEKWRKSRGLDDDSKEPIRNREGKIVEPKRKAAPTVEEAKDEGTPTASRERKSLEEGGSGFKKATRDEGKEIMDRQSDAMRRHRDEMERPIKIRYENEGIRRSGLGAEGVQARRANDSSMRYARQNSYSDTGVA